MNPKKFAVLKDWNALRGFGFLRIVDENGQVIKYFLHVTEIVSGEPKIGAGVYFLVSDKPPKPGNVAAAIQAEIGEVLPKFKTRTDAANIEGVL